MPWFPELEQAKLSSAKRVGFYEGILSLDTGVLENSFADTPLIDDPLRGHIEGIEALEVYVQAVREWLSNISTAIDPVALTKTPERTVEEVSIKLKGDHPELPVAIVTDLSVDDLIKAIRIYHSLWPLTGEHRVRAPLLRPDPLIELKGAPADYQRGLAAGDAQAVIAAFEPDATVREPSGGPYTYHGEVHHKIYDLMFANGGGIPLEFCTVTDDGTACAIEYNCVKWGKDKIPPQAGVAVYVRGKSGLLAAARIYDDVTPPQSSDSSIQDS
jgi:hypothetical protein